MYTYAFPSYDQASLENVGYDGFGQVEGIGVWDGRAGYAQWAVNRARAAGHAASQALLTAALTYVTKAREVITFQKANNIWTTQGEQAVSGWLAKARDAFNAAQGIAATTPPRVQFPVPFPTWTMASSGLPEGSPGGVSPGVLPSPAGGGPALPPGLPPGLAPQPWLLRAGLGGLPNWLLLAIGGGVAAVAGGATFFRRS